MDQGTIIVNRKGERYQLSGSEWVPLPSLEQAERQRYAESLAKEAGPLGAFKIGVAKALGAGLWGDMPNKEVYEGALQRQHPISSFAGQVAPGLVAAPLAGMSVPGQAAIGAVAGGLSGDSAGSAALGALTGGALGGLGTAGANYLARTLPGALRGAGEAVEQMGMSVQPFGIASRVQARIANRMGAGGGAPGAGIDAAAEGAMQGRYLKGALTPDEAKQMGLPLTPGDELLLQAPNAESARMVGTIRTNEELARSMPGGYATSINAVRDQQRQWLTARVATEAGLNPEEAITPAALGARFRELGAVFDEAAKVAGRVDIPEATMARVRTVVENADTSHQGQLQRILADVEKHQKLSQGALTGEAWQQVRTNLGNMVDAGTRQGNYAKVSDAAEFQQVLQEALEQALPDTIKAELAQARQQYRTLKILTGRAGVLNPEGEINAVSLANALGKNPGRYKRAEDDPFYRAVDTLKTLQALKVPNSGTANRLLANPMGMGQAAAQKYGGSAAAATGGGLAATGLANLFGD